MTSERTAINKHISPFSKTLPCGEARRSSGRAKASSCLEKQNSDTGVASATPHHQCCCLTGPLLFLTNYGSETLSTAASDSVTTANYCCFSGPSTQEKPQTLTWEEDEGKST